MPVRAFSSEARRSERTVAASVKRTTNQSIPNNAITKVQWQAVEYQVGPVWNSGNSTRLVAPVGGYYHIGACAGWATGAGRRLWRFLVNGTTELCRVNENDFYLTDTTLSTDAFLSAGQYVELEVLQVTGGPIDLAANVPCRMWMHQVA